MLRWRSSAILARWAKSSLDDTINNFRIRIINQFIAFSLSLKIDIFIRQRLLNRCDLFLCNFWIFQNRLYLLLSKCPLRILWRNFGWTQSTLQHIVSRANSWTSFVLLSLSEPYLSIFRTLFKNFVTLKMCSWPCVVCIAHLLYLLNFFLFFFIIQFKFKLFLIVLAALCICL